MTTDGVGLQPLGSKTRDHGIPGRVHRHTHQGTARIPWFSGRFPTASSGSADGALGTPLAGLLAGPVVHSRPARPNTSSGNPRKYDRSPRERGWNYRFRNPGSCRMVWPPREASPLPGRSDRPPEEIYSSHCSWMDHASIHERPANAARGSPRSSGHSPVEPLVSCLRFTSVNVSRRRDS